MFVIKKKHINIHFDQSSYCDDRTCFTFGVSTELFNNVCYCSSAGIFWVKFWICFVIVALQTVSFGGHTQHTTLRLFQKCVSYDAINNIDIFTCQ